MDRPLPTHAVRAHNGAATSENKIHDDATAQKFGFKGALVPGVAVFAYMAHVPVAHFGHAWLERGAAECRFLKPLYHGDIARATAPADGDAPALLVERQGEGGGAGGGRRAGAWGGERGRAWRAGPRLEAGAARRARDRLPAHWHAAGRA